MSEVTLDITSGVEVELEITAAEPDTDTGGGGADLSDADPTALDDAADPGVAEEASRADHVHPKPALGDLSDVEGPFADDDLAIFNEAEGKWQGIGLIRGLPSTSFIFNSDGPRSGTRFNDWAELMDASGDVAYGGDRFILFEQPESTAMTTVDMPVGGWDLNGLGWQGLAGSSPSAGTGVQLTLPDGFKLVNAGVDFAKNGLLIYTQSSEPVIDIGGSGRSFYLSNDAIICSQQCEFFRVSATSGLVLFSIRLGAGIRRPSEVGIEGGDYESVNITGSPSFCLTAEPIGYSNIGDNVFRSVSYTTDLAVDVSSGVFTITVDNADPITVGNPVTISDGVHSETHIVGNVEGDVIYFAGETLLADGYAASATTVTQHRGMLRVVQSPAANTAEGNTQTNLTGGYYVVNQALAANIAADPSDNTYLTGASVQAQLDQAEAKLADLEARLALVEDHNFVVLLDDGEAIPGWVRSDPETVVVRRPPP